MLALPGQSGRSSASRITNSRLRAPVPTFSALSLNVVLQDLGQYGRPYEPKRHPCIAPAPDLPSRTPLRASCVVQGSPKATSLSATLTSQPGQATSCRTGGHRPSRPWRARHYGHVVVTDNISSGKHGTAAGSGAIIFGRHLGIWNARARSRLPEGRCNTAHAECDGMASRGQAGSDGFEPCTRRCSCHEALSRSRSSPRSTASPGLSPLASS